MPSIQLRPGRRTYYLDTSTLSYAFRGGEPASADGSKWSRLHSFVEGIAQTENLCLSTMHIAELAQGREDAVHATFSWLDALDVVWMLNFSQVSALEDEYVLQCVAGCPPSERVNPFESSLLSVFEHWQWDSLAEVLRSSSPLRALATGARERGVEAEKKGTREMVARIQYDRNEDPLTLAASDAEKVAEIERKWRDQLRKDAHAAWNRLRWKGSVPAAVHEWYRGTVDAAALFADYVSANPARRPSSCMSNVFASAFANVAAARKPGSKGSHALESSFHDYAHLAIGASYCDVFTCDELAAKCMADAATMVGRRAPIVYRGDADAFIGALEAG